MRPRYSKAACGAPEETPVDESPDRHRAQPDPAVSWYNVDRNGRRRILKGLGIDTRQAAAE